MNLEEKHEQLVKLVRFISWTAIIVICLDAVREIYMGDFEVAYWQIITSVWIFISMRERKGSELWRKQAFRATEVVRGISDSIEKQIKKRS